MVHYKAAHRRWTPAERFIEPFSKRTFLEPENLLDDYTGRGPAAANQKMTIARHMSLGADLKVSRRPERKAYLAGKTREGDELTRWKYQAYMRDYLACTPAWTKTSARSSITCRTPAWTRTRW